MFEAHPFACLWKSERNNTIRLGVVQITMKLPTNRPNRQTQNAQLVGLLENWLATLVIKRKEPHFVRSEFHQQATHPPDKTQNPYWSNPNKTLTVNKPITKLTKTKATTTNVIFPACATASWYCLRNSASRGSCAIACVVQGVKPAGCG